MRDKEGTAERWKAEKANSEITKPRKEVVPQRALRKKMIDPEPQPMTGRITKKTETAGVRRLSRLTGIVIFLGSLGAFPIGTAIGIPIMISLFIIGNRMATKYYCGSCGSPVDSTKVKMCPVCKISLK